MAEQRELFAAVATVGKSHSSAAEVGNSQGAPVLVVEDGGNVVRLYVEGAPAPKYGPGLGRKPRRAP